MAPRYALALTALALPASICAKPAPRDYPDGLSVGKTAAGPVYVDGRHKTLYSMSLRWARARSGVGMEYCAAACLAAWTPLLAKADAKPVGDWSVVQGPKGPQWAYQRNPVFSFNADQKPGETRGEGYDYLWSTLFYTPPKPTIAAPPSVATTPVKGENILTSLEGAALFTAPLVGSAMFTPFAAAMVSQPLGDWTVLRHGDTPQWAWRGKPVFVSQEQVPTDVPAGGKVLKP